MTRCPLLAHCHGSCHPGQNTRAGNTILNHPIPNQGCHSSAWAQAFLQTGRDPTAGEVAAVCKAESWRRGSSSCDTKARASLLRAFSGRVLLARIYSGRLGSVGTMSSIPIHPLLVFQPLTRPHPLYTESSQASPELRSAISRVLRTYSQKES